MAKNTEKNSRDFNIRARKKYYKERTKRMTISFNVESEADMIEHLWSQESMSGYLKDLIRKDMK